MGVEAGASGAATRGAGAGWVAVSLLFVAFSAFAAAAFVFFAASCDVSRLTTKEGPFGRASRAGDETISAGALCALPAARECALVGAQPDQS